MVDVTICCPSHRRAGSVSSFATFGDELLLCVAESEGPAYRAEHPEARIDVHPDAVVGITAKRNWMIEKYGSLFMVDDDGRRMVDMQTMEKLEPAQAVDVVQRAADTAEATGAYLFGLNQSSIPLHFFPGKPFRMSGEVTAGSWGLLEGHDLPLCPPSEMAVAEDIWFSAVNAWKHRKVFVDDRFNIPMKMGTNPGGCQDLRTQLAIDRTLEFLRQSFGDAITHNPSANVYPWRFRVGWK